MLNVQCPLCFMPLEPRDVTPCFICGGWPNVVMSFREGQEFARWRLPQGEELILCRPCELEEFMVPGGWGWRLQMSTQPLPLHHLQFVRKVEKPQLGKDRFCPTCNLRWAFLQIVDKRKEAADVSSY